MTKQEKAEELLATYRNKPTYENYLKYVEVRDMPDDTVFPDENHKHNKKAPKKAEV